MTKKEKPFLDYHDRINKLKIEYGMEISDKNSAIEILNTIPYHDLINGYKDIFMNKDRFLEKLNLRDLFLFVVHDKDFKNILLKYSLYVENIFKNKLAYILSKNYGINPNDYLNAKNFIKYKSNKTEKIKALKETLHRIKIDLKENKEEIIEHYRDSYSYIPPWIAIKIMTFNTSINLYRILKHKDKMEIYKEYNLFYNHDENTLGSIINMMHIIRKFRNKIAHNHKTANYRIVSYKINKNNVVNLKFKDILISEEDIQKKIGTDDIYSMILSIIVLLNNDVLISKFIHELFSFFQSKPSIQFDYIKKINLPLNVIERFKTFTSFIDYETSVGIWENFDY